MKKLRLPTVVAFPGRFARRRVGVMLVCVLAAGCTYHTDPLTSQPGTLTVTVPGSFPAGMSRQSPAAAPAAAAVTPEQRPGSEAALEPAALPTEGRYTGSATLISNPGGHCTRMAPINNWVVTGDRVRFGAFRGTIRPDGSLSMQGGPGHIKGHFEGSRFTGRFWRPGRACTYALTLEAVG